MSSERAESRVRAETASYVLGLAALILVVMMMGDVPIGWRIAGGAVAAIATLGSLITIWDLAKSAALHRTGAPHENFSLAFVVVAGFKGTMALVGLFLLNHHVLRPLLEADSFISKVGILFAVLIAGIPLVVLAVLNLGAVVPGIVFNIAVAVAGLDRRGST